MMQELDEIRDYCLSQTAVTEDFPFGEDVLVFRVKGKIFCLTNVEDFPSQINLKCEPQKALELRERYSSVIPGYHMNKKHWNTIVLDGSIPSDIIQEMVDHSYGLIVKKLKKSDRQELERLQEQEAQDLASAKVQGTVPHP